MTPDEGGDLLFDVQRDDVDAASVFPDCDTPENETNWSQSNPGI